MDGLLQLSPGLQMDLFDAVEDCKAEPMYGELFSEPVDYLGPPFLQGYLQIIHRPMDYSRLEQNLNMRQYEYLYQFLRDLALIFENCRVYNAGAPYFKRAADNAERYIFWRISEINELKQLTFDKYLQIAYASVASFEAKRQHGSSAAEVRAVYAYLGRLKRGQIEKIFGQARVKVDYRSCREIEKKILESLK